MTNRTRLNCFAWSCTMVFLTTLFAAVWGHIGSGEFLYLGFPIHFLTIHIQEGFEPGLHVGLGGLLLDLGIGYLVSASIARIHGKHNLA